METNRIILSFGNTITDLVGNKFGRSVYQQQVKSQIDYTKLNVLVLSDGIEDVAMSFIQGICHELIEEYGKEKTKELISIQTSKQEIIDKFNRTMAL